MIQLRKFTDSYHWSNAKFANEEANKFLSELTDEQVIQVTVEKDSVTVLYKDDEVKYINNISSIELLKELGRRNFIIDYWTEDDVMYAIDEFNEKSQDKKIEYDELNKIIERICEANTTEIGMSWDIISMCLHNHVNERDNPIDNYMHG